jgi:hypothetical protein
MRLFLILLLLLLAAPAFTAETQTTYTTPGTYNWTVPSGVSSIRIDCWGSGGGGGNLGSFHPESITIGETTYEANWYDNGGGGGGGGAYARKTTFSVTTGQVLTVVVPSGGSGVFSSVSLSGTPICKAESGYNGSDGSGPSGGHWECCVGGVPSFEFDDFGYSGSPGGGGQSSNCIGDYVLSGTEGSSGNGGAGANGAGNGATIGGPQAGSGKVLFTYTIVIPPRLIVVDQ